MSFGDDTSFNYPSSYDNIANTADNNKSYFCCFGSKADAPHDSCPDAHFHADSLVSLSNGLTAYRLIEPKTNPTDGQPVIVCMHGLTNSSFMWSDVCDLLADFDQGPQGRVLVFDFYGRGRSPWSGAEITMDTLVLQTKELLEFLNLDESPVALVGYDMGGAVAVGFAAKFPSLCISLSLISPLGYTYNSAIPENSLSKKWVGEYTLYKHRKKMASYQEMEFYDRDRATTHRYLIDKQADMVDWQIKNTPGYLPALLSTYRFFPLRKMKELFTAIGKHPRRVLVIWGDQDVICPFKQCIDEAKASFPNGNIVEVCDCGHNTVYEKFEDVVRELLSFNKLVFDDSEDPEENMSTLEFKISV